MTDLVALSVLPVSYVFYIRKANQSLNDFQPVFFKRPATSGIVLVSIFAFTATSHEEDRKISIDKKYELDMNIAEFENRVKNTKSFEILKFEKETEAFPSNQYPNVKTDPNGYYLFFDLQEEYCESKKLRIFISLKFENKVVINSSNLDYWCPNPPSDEDKQNVNAIFEREVIEKLRQNNPQ